MPKRNINTKKKWKVLVTDPKGKPLKDWTKDFSTKEDAIKYAGEVYHQSGRGKLRSIFYEFPQ